MGVSSMTRVLIGCEQLENQGFAENCQLLPRRSARRCRKEHPDMMSASEGGGGSWKSGRSKGG